MIFPNNNNENDDDDVCPELGLDDRVEYKYVPIGPPPPAPELEEFRKTVNPHGTVPVLEIEGGPTILESSAICLYLADLCGKFAPEPKNRAEYYQWVKCVWFSFLVFYTAK